MVADIFFFRSLEQQFPMWAVHAPGNNQQIQWIKKICHLWLFASFFEISIFVCSTNNVSTVCIHQKPLEVTIKNL